MFDVVAFAMWVGSIIFGFIFMQKTELDPDACPTFDNPPAGIRARWAAIFPKLGDPNYTYERCLADWQEITTAADLNGDGTVDRCEDATAIYNVLG